MITFLKIALILAITCFLLAMCGPKSDVAQREWECNRQSNGVFHNDGQARLSCLQRARQ